MRRRPSLYGPKEDGCARCGWPHVEQHHILPSSRRPISDREGLTVYLCKNCHQGPRGVHRDAGFDRELRRDAQRRWEAREVAEGSTPEEAREAFRAVFYKSYL